MVIGQISDSTKMARSGAQWSRKRLIAGFRSSGTNWWMTSEPSRSRTTLAEVAVFFSQIRDALPIGFNYTLGGQYQQF